MTTTRKQGRQESLALRRSREYPTEGDMMNSFVSTLYGIVICYSASHGYWFVVLLALVLVTDVALNGLSRTTATAR